MRERVFGVVAEFMKHQSQQAELFGARLRELRADRGESQRSLAELTGITYACIREMERGLNVAWRA